MLLSPKRSTYLRRGKGLLETFKANMKLINEYKRELSIKTVTSSIANPNNNCKADLQKNTKINCNNCLNLKRMNLFMLTDSKHLFKKTI